MELLATLKVEPEFRDKIPPLTDAEFEQLRENILEAGEVYEPIRVWEGTVIDGHNRLKVIREHPEIKWQTRDVEFADKWAAFDWMYRNQLGRRNLTEEQRTYMVGKMYEARKKSVGNTTTARNADGTFQSGQNDRIGSRRETKDGTAGQIGKEVGMGEKNVRRAEKFAKGIDVLRELSPESAEKVLSGKTGVTKKDVAELAKADDGDVEAFAEAVKADRKPPRPKRPPKTEEEKRDMAEIEAIVKDMCDPSTTPEFTIDWLIDDIEMNAEVYVQLLKDTIEDRRYLVTDDNKPRIASAITRIIEDIRKVRDLL
jgi:hypothetical protein